MALGGLKVRLLAGAALLVVAGPAMAADLSSDVSMKDAPATADALAITGSVDLTNDYIFRGISQNRRDPALQGELDLAYGMFYAGTFWSGVDFDAPGASPLLNSSVEIDLYAGIKPKLGDVTFDIGVITYNYPGSTVTHPSNFDPNYIEAKLGASITVLTDLALSGTAFFSPDYSGETGRTIVLEGTASKPITKIGGVDWSASGTVGYVAFEDSHPTGVPGVDYTYGNLGVTGTLGMLSLDLRWWDTSLSAGQNPCANGTNVFQCGNAFAATFKFAF